MSKTPIIAEDWAKHIIQQIEGSAFWYHYKRFDIRTSYYRVYGRLSTIPYDSIRFHSLSFHEDIRGQGLFKALVEQSLRHWQLPVYIQSINNPTFLKHFEKNECWIKVEPMWMDENYVRYPDGDRHTKQ